VHALRVVILNACVMYAAAQLSNAYWAFTYLSHGPRGQLCTAAHLLPAYPTGAFEACPACATFGYPDVEGGDAVVILLCCASDACFKIWNYAKNAGKAAGRFKWFKNSVHDEVQADAAKAVSGTDTAPLEPIPADVCKKEFKALLDKERTGTASKVQASGCVGATLCEHGAVGRNSLVFSDTGASV